MWAGECLMRLSSSGYSGPVPHAPLRGSTVAWSRRQQRYSSTSSWAGQHPPEMYRSTSADRLAVSGIEAQRALGKCGAGSTHQHPPEMYCSTSADSLAPSPATASAPAPLAGAPGTTRSNLRAARWEVLGCTEVNSKRTEVNRKHTEVSSRLVVEQTPGSTRQGCKASLSPPNCCSAS